MRSRHASNTQMPGTRPGMAWQLSMMLAGLSGGRLGHRPARKHADKVRAILRAAMDIARHAVGGDGHAVERLRAEALLEGLLERGHPEHAVGAGAGDRDADIGP